MSDNTFIDTMMEKVLNGQNVSFGEALKLSSSPDFSKLTQAAKTITKRFCGELVDVEALINAKSGACPEDCTFCAQSSFYETGIKKYQLLPLEVILDKAREARNKGAKSFCLVGAYRSPPEADFLRICQIIKELKRIVDIDVNVSLGFMTIERARILKALGVKRYNHNLETSESHFSSICRTHDFQERVNTARIVKEAGLELCCGGIIGIGESQEQRLELAFSIASLKADEVPINILITKKGTPLYNLPPLEPLDAIRTISIWRFIMPRAIIKIAGGREVHLKDKDKLALNAGANGIITGGYLTSSGNTPDKDMLTIKEIGLKV
jgi:biotin synthase